MEPTEEEGQRSEVRGETDNEKILVSSLKMKTEEATCLYMVENVCLVEPST